MKKTIRRILCGAVAAAAVGLATLVPTPAQAADRPNGNLYWGAGTLLRAQFSEHQNGEGYQIFVYGYRTCTTTTTDTDWQEPYLTQNWDNQISRIRDFNLCDVKVYEDAWYGGDSSQYHNYGSYGLNLPSWTGWGDRISSFKLS